MIMCDVYAMLFMTRPSFHMNNVQYIVLPCPCLIYNVTCLVHILKSIQNLYFLLSDTIST